MWFNALLFLAPFGAYLATMTGAFLADDSPETISCMLTLEHMHPPGYPLLTMVGRLFLLLPLGAPSLRGAVLAAAGAALAAALAGICARRMARMSGGEEGTGLIAAGLGAALAGFGLTMWGQALSAKGAVYSLNACILLGVVRLWLEDPGKGGCGRRDLGAALLLGLGAAHHWMSIAAFLPGLLFLRFYGRGRRMAMGPLALSLMVFLAGCSVYLLLPVRAPDSGLAINWGRPERVAAFFEVVTRSMYREAEALSRGEGYWSARLVHALSWASREWTPLFAWMGLAGLVRADLLGLRVAGGLGLAAAGVLAGAILIAFPLSGRFEVTEPYMLPATLAWGLLAGTGMAHLLAHPVVRRAGYAFAVLVPAGMAALNWARVDHSRDYLSYDYGVNLLSAAPRGAAVFCEGDIDLFALLYLDRVEHRRPDVAVVAAVFFDYDWYRETAHRRFPEMIPREHRLGEYVVKPVRPLVYTPQHSGGEDVLRPVGMILRPPLGEGYDTASGLRAWRDVRTRGLWDRQAEASRLAVLVAHSYASQLVWLGRAMGGGEEAQMEFLRRLVRFPSDGTERSIRRYALASMLLKRGRVEEAKRQAGLAIEDAPGAWRPYYLLANIRYVMGERDEARRLLARAISLVPPEADAERRRMEALLEQAR